MTDPRTEARQLLDAATPIGDDAPGYYVTDSGRVLSTTGWRGVSVRELAQSPDKDGYMRVRLTPPSGKQVRASVHSLVARAFHGACPPGQQCRHLNGDKLDNRASNLAWGTPVQNANDRDAHGSTARGTTNGWARLTDDAVRAIRRDCANGESQRTVARRYGTSQRNVGRIVHRQRWTHVEDQ